MSRQKTTPQTKLIIPRPAIALIIITAVLVIVLGIKYLQPRPLNLPKGHTVFGRLLVNAPEHHIGDLIIVDLEIKATNGIEFTMPDLATEDLGGLVLKEKGETETIKLRGGLTKKVRYKLTCWETGEFLLPKLTFSYKDKDGMKKEYSVPGRKIKIVSVLPKGRSKEELLALKIKGDKGPVSLPPAYQILRWFLLGAAICGLMIILIQLIRKVWPKKAEKDEVSPEIIEPAHVIAFRKLEALKKKGYLDAGDFKAYYSELSECMREYMENRFKIRALEMTTEEFLFALTSNQLLPHKQQNILREFLRFSDLVKFAKHLPTREEAEKALALVYQLIEETKETLQSTVNSDQ